jgi:LysR family tcuABC transcriptional regulator
LELRQIRYFVRAAELGSISRAATDLGAVQSAVSQHITRLETELNVRLLRRTSRGVEPTEGGLAFLREAQLILRHTDQACRAAQQARLTGSASVGFAPTTACVLALPFMREMRARFPDVRLHIVEGLSGQLAELLNTRKIDVAVLFNVTKSLHWNVTQMLEERLFLISARAQRGQQPQADVASLNDLRDVPLILPTAGNGLRTILDAAFERSGTTPAVIAEVDSLAILMDAVRSGLGATIQPRAAMRRFPDAAESFHFAEIADLHVRHVNSLCSLGNEELSPAALATLATLKSCMRTLVGSGAWPDASLT